MKVIYVTSSTTVFGGGSKSFVNMLDGLIPYGIEPLVIFPDANGLSEVLANKNIPTKVLTYRMAVYPPLKTAKDILWFIPRLAGRIFVNIKASRQLYKISQEFGAEIIHTNVSVINIGYTASRRLHIPHIWHIREYGDKDFQLYYYPCKKYHLRKLHLPHSYSICITKDILQYNGLQNEHQAQTIYNGVLSQTDIRFSKEKEPYFLYAGRLEVNKGISDLLDAYSIFRQQRTKSSLRLKIAGDTSDKRHLNMLYKKVKELEIQDYVDFLGARKDILELMYKAYVTIIPSVSEGFGRVMSEAMFNGSLVVGRNTAGTKEQFDNGVKLIGKEIGLRYNTQDELVQRMCEVEDNGIEHYYPMIKYSQRIVADLYTLENHAKQMYQLYQNILYK